MTEYNTILVSMVAALIIGSFLLTMLEASLTLNDAERLNVDKCCRDYLTSIHRGLHITEGYSIRKLSGNRFQAKYIVFKGLDTQAFRATFIVKNDKGELVVDDEKLEGEI